MSDIVLLAGMGFGNEGKGSITDWLCSQGKYPLVVRYNGGPQTGHNVVTGGVTFCYSQFGSGAQAGARTHISRFVYVNPILALNEGAELKSLGLTDIFQSLTVEDRAPIVTPFHVAANRIRERARGDRAHGSSGQGVGETARDVLAGDETLILRAGDLRQPEVVIRKLRKIQEHKRAQLQDLREQTRRHADLVPHWTALDAGDLYSITEAYSQFARSGLSLVNAAWLNRILADRGTTVFEGAHGALLDQDWGFHPHTTWSRCTFANADELLRGALIHRAPLRLGVIGAYSHRHGPGPFPAEDTNNWFGVSMHDHNNKLSAWQGPARCGPFDRVMAKYAHRVLGDLDGLVVTQLDRLDRAPRYEMVTGYEMPDPDPELFVAFGSVVDSIQKAGKVDLDRQARLGKALLRGRPVREAVSGARIEFGREIADYLGVPLVVQSVGPTRSAKIVSSLQSKLLSLGT